MAEQIPDPAPTSEPIPSPEPAAATTQEPASPPSAPAETSAAAEPPKPADTPSLLDFPKEEVAPAAAEETKAEPEAKKDENKPAETKAEEPKPAEAKPVEPAPKPEDAPKPAEPPSYADMVLPEGLTRDAKLDAFTGILGKSAVPVEAAQELLGMHTEAMKQYAEHLSREQYRVFGETRAGWVKDVMADPQLGGAGHQTAMGAIARMRDKFVSEADRPAFEEFLRVTGAGDHPQFLKLLHNASRAFDEPPLPPPNPKPPANNGNGKAGRRVLYDHPSSQAGRP